MLLGFLVVFLASKPTTEHSRYLIGLLTVRLQICGPKGIALPELALLYQTRAKGGPRRARKAQNCSRESKGKEGRAYRNARFVVVVFHIISFADVIISPEGPNPRGGKHIGCHFVGLLISFSIKKVAQLEGQERRDQKVR